MKIINRKIYYTGLTEFKVTGSTTSQPAPTNSSAVFKAAPLPPQIIPVDFEIPILLEQTFEDIGIYTDFLQSIIYDGEEILGKSLTTNQTQFILNKRNDILIYINNEINNNTLGNKTIHEYVQNWWDEVGKFETGDNKIRPEELLAIESKIISTAKKNLSTSSVIEVKSIVSYLSNEIDLDFRAYLNQTIKYVIDINGYSSKYTPQAGFTNTQLVEDIVYFINNDPTYAPLGVTATYYEKQRQGVTHIYNPTPITITDRFIKLKASNVPLVYKQDIIYVDNLDPAVAVALDSGIFNPNTYGANYSDKPILPNATIVTQTSQATPITIYSSITNGLTGFTLDQSYIEEFLGYEYSSTTTNWEINKNGFKAFFGNNKTITGVTTNRLSEISTYNNVDPIKVGINNVTQVNNLFTAYTINSINYITYSGDDLYTTYTIISNGFNEDNIILDNIIKEEHLDGVVFSPEIQNNVFIERQNDSILLPVFRVNQIVNTEAFTTYDNGFYVVDNQTIGIKHKPK